MSKKCNCSSSGCCSASSVIIDEKVLEMPNKILLMGNPNVGKSVFFSSLTGTYVTSSNFAGTTVSYTKAKYFLVNKPKDKNDKEAMEKHLASEYQFIDVPGTYSLSASSEAEQVAVSFMESKPRLIICVLDATNLTRNLNLALEIQKVGIPVIFALNLMDIAKRKGIIIDKEKLSKELNAPVIETVAVKKEGFDELEKAIEKMLDTTSAIKLNDTLNTNEKLWNRSFEISKNVTSKAKSEPSKIDKIGDAMVKPWPGVPIAILIIIVSLCIIVFGGKGIRGVITYPLCQAIIGGFNTLITGMNLPTFIENILVGEYGILNIGIQWPIDFILPFVTMFYLVFTFLEDCGILPRLAVLFDNIMRKMGVQGGSLISLMMGYGCAVPAVIGTRNCTTKKERIIIASMVCFGVPCISQLGALITLCTQKPVLTETGEALYIEGVLQTTSSMEGLPILICIFLFSFLLMFLVSVVLGKMLKGKIDPLVIEVPNLLIPERKSYFKKFCVRMKSFLVEAEIPMLLAVLIIAIVQGFGILDFLATAASPVVETMLGLPEEATLSLILGIIRKELSVIPLIGTNLSMLQLFVAGIVTLSYLPCIAVYGVLSKEFNARTAVVIVLSTFVGAILIGSAINWIGQLFILIF